MSVAMCQGAVRAEQPPVKSAPWGLSLLSRCNFSNSVWHCLGSSWWCTVACWKDPLSSLVSKRFFFEHVPWLSDKFRASSTIADAVYHSTQKETKTGESGRLRAGGHSGRIQGKQVFVPINAHVLLRLIPIVHEIGYCECFRSRWKHDDVVLLVWLTSCATPCKSPIAFGLAFQPVPV